jgi:hypothetical protein
MNPTSMGRLLATYCLKGLVTLETLDKPSPLWLSIEDDRRNANNRAARQKHPSVFPDTPPYRNLARDWIQANSSEWDQMLIQTLNDESDQLPVEPLQGM